MDMWSWESAYFHGYIGNWPQNNGTKAVIRRPYHQETYTLTLGNQTLSIMEFTTLHNGATCLLGHFGLAWLCLLANDDKVGRQPGYNLYLLQIPPKVSVN